MDHEKRLTEVESRSKSNTKRLDAVEKRQDSLDELVSTVKVLAAKESNVESVVEEIKSDVKSLTLKPARRWENVIDKVILLFVAAVTGFILSKLGL